MIQYIILIHTIGAVIGDNVEQSESFSVEISSEVYEELMSYKKTTENQLEAIVYGASGPYLYKGAIIHKFDKDAIGLIHFHYSEKDRSWGIQGTGKVVLFEDLETLVSDDERAMKQAIRQARKCYPEYFNTMETVEQGNIEQNESSSVEISSEDYQELMSYKETTENQLRAIVYGASGPYLYKGAIIHKFDQDAIGLIHFHYSEKDRSWGIQGTGKFVLFEDLEVLVGDDEGAMEEAQERYSKYVGDAIRERNR